MNEVEMQIEALLFSSGKAMSVELISSITDFDKKKVKNALKKIKEDYDSRNTSLKLFEEGESWKLNIREQYISLVTKIIADTELSKPVLETLSVIAWKSPVFQSDIIKARSSAAYEHIQELVDAGFITKERSGRSFVLKTAEKFFEYFDVPGDKAMKEVFKEVKLTEKKEQKLGSLEVVSVENNSQEHGKTAEIFGEHQIDKPAPLELKKPIDFEEHIDRDFLDKVNSQIDGISKRNDEIDKDVLFQRKSSLENSEEIDSEENNSSADYDDSSFNEESEKPNSVEEDSSEDKKENVSS
jgi:segregation and condensation protein B